MGSWHRLVARICLALAIASWAAFPVAGRSPSPSGQLPEGAAQLFQYDAAQPLDLRSVARDALHGVTVSDVTYASPKGGRVTAYLVAPASPGPFAGILFGHWGGGNRTEFLPEAILYARAGAVCLLPDYPWTRPAPWRRALQYSSGPDNDFEAYVQAVIDLRRGIDLLVARGDVDVKRLGYVGHSYGAQWGAILAAIDRRFKAVVLAGGVPDLGAIYLESDDPDTVALRASDPARVARLLDVMAPLLFQFARYEQNFPDSAMQRYYRAASEPKRVVRYSTGHDLNDPQALLDRAAWLQEHLGIGPVWWPTVKGAR